MKIRLISWLASGLAIAASMLTLVARADSNSATHFSPVLAEVRLTPSQQTQLEALSARIQSQLDKLLAPEQQAQFGNALARGDSMRAAIQSLDLPFDRHQQLQNILQTLQSQLEVLLTPEQKQQIWETLQTSQQ